MWRSLHDAWWRLATQDHPHGISDTLAQGALRAGSLVYGAGLRCRTLAYDRGWRRPSRLPCRVVSVGNLTVGGTGKTACVALIARKLAASGRRVAVLSRGYGGARSAYALRSDGQTLLVNGTAGSAEGLADEPQLLARQLQGVPVLVDPRRDRSGRLACDMFRAQVAILDDGFQHRRLHRDLDIVLIRAGMPLGGWPLLPRGPMREPLEALRRAHIIFVTKADEALSLLGALTERLHGFNRDAALVTATHRPTHLLEPLSGARHEPQRLQGLRLGVVSSIGDPAGFESTLRQLQGHVQWHLAYPDHHRYTAADCAAIGAKIAAAKPDAVVTTEKDWVRLGPLAASADWAVPCWVLGIEMAILDGERELDARLARVCAG